MNLYNLYGNPDDTARLMFGEDARHVAAWMYVQHQGDGTVSFVGSSRVDRAHPLRYGSDRSHQFIVGEMVIRPHLVVATDALRGYGLSALATNDHNFAEMLQDGETLIDRGVR